MTNEDLCFTPAAELAALIRARKLSPVELTDIVLDRLHALEPKLNAFITITDDQARIDARRAEQAVMDGETLGPLHGVPMGLKDFIETKGVRTTFGSHLMVDNVPKQDSVVAARVRAAGGIFLGKTMGPDMGWKATGDSILTGSSHNPWSLDHTPGGSSSGACATVAAGIGTLTVGTDGAGSIRIPASFCGVFGLKPSYGRVPQPGQSPTNGSHTGPIGRTVADGALLLKVIAGPHESDPATLQAAPKDYPALLETGVAGKRMAWSLDLGFAEMMDPEVADLCAKAARAFEDTGAIVEEATPDWGNPMPIIRDFWPALWAGRIGHAIEEFRDRLDPGLVACAEVGLRQRPETFFKAQMERVAFCERTHHFFERYDFLLTPTVAVPALKIGRIVPDGCPDHPWDWLSWCPFGFPFNLTWHPAATVPAGFTRDGRPVGLQIVGRRFDDLGVLQASAAFERVRPWAQVRPPLDTGSGQMTEPE